MAYTKELKNGKYRVIISSGYDSAGKRIRHDRVIEAASLDEAKLIAGKMEAEIQKGDISSVTTVTFAELVDRFSETRYTVDSEGKGVKMAITTIKKNENVIEELKRSLGAIKLRDMNYETVQRYIDSLSFDGARRDGKKGKLAPKTIRNRFIILQEICKYGIRLGLMKNNPCECVQLPKQRKPEIEILDIDEIKTMMAYLNDEPIKYRVAVGILLSCGLRRSELMGLEWKDIDLDGGVVNILRSSQYISGIGLRETELKTNASRRTIPLAQGLINLLAEYKAWQEQQRLEAGQLWTETDRLMVDDFGKPLNPDSVGQWFERFLDRHAIRHISLHGLRHTYVSMLISKNVDIKTVSAQAGHSTPTTTLGVYAHLFKKLDRTTANIFDSALY